MIKTSQASVTLPVIFIAIGVALLCIIASSGITYNPDLILPLLGGGIVILVAIRRMDFLIFLTMALLVMAQLNWEIYSMSSQYGRWIPFFLFGLIIIAQLGVRSSLMRRFYVFDTWILMWVAFALLTASYSVLPGLTIMRGTTLFLTYVAVFWGIWGYADYKGEEHIVGIFLLFCVGIYGLSWLLFPFISVFQDDGRFRGIMSNPNALGSLTVLFFPLVLTTVLIKRRICDYLLAGVMFLSLILTGHRGGMFACGIGAAYVFFKARSRMFFLVIFVVGLVTFSFFIKGVLPQAWINSPFLRHELLMGGRDEAWPIVIDLIKERLFFGYGFGTEEFVFEPFQEYMKFFRGGTAHNSYLGLTLQTGLFGTLTFFLPLIFFAVRQFFGSWQDSELELTHGIQGVFFSGLILCYSESSIYSMGSAYSFPFWIIVMLLIHRSLKKDAYSKSNTRLSS